MLLLFLVSSLSPSQLWMLNTTAALYRISVSLSQFRGAHGAKMRHRWMLREGTDWGHRETVGSESAYHPTYLLRMKMAAMGRVEEMVDWNSTLSPFAAGS